MSRPAVRFASAADRRAGAADPPPWPAQSGPHLAGAPDLVAEAGQLLDADRAARMDAAGGDPDLRPEAEFAAVAELGGGVPQRHRAIDGRQEMLRDRGILGHDRIGMGAAMA